MVKQHAFSLLVKEINKAFFLILSAV